VEPVSTTTTLGTLVHPATAIRPATRRPTRVALVLLAPSGLFLLAFTY
jgi:hypothetical protein